MASFRDSGEAKESKQQGTKASRQRQKDIGRRAGKELKGALERGRVSPEGTEYTGKLAETMMRQNLDQFNQRQLRRRAIEDAPQRPGIMQGLKNFGQGIMSNLTPQRMLGSALGTALLGPLGGILGGLIGGTYGDDDPSNNFFGKIGSSLKKDATDTLNFGKQIGQNLKTDFLDTIDFFTPQQVEQSMMTNMPMKRPMQMFPIKNVTQTTGMPGMEQIPDMFPDNLGQPTYKPEAAGFGIDSLMQPKQNETFTMPDRIPFMDYGTMPRVTSAPLGTSSTPIGEFKDLFGNPVVSNVNTFDPSVEVIDLGTADREIKPGTFSDNLSFQDIVNIFK
jgi:hypothetical protein